MIGPFGEGRPSFRTAFPPEAERRPPEIGRSYPGKMRDVGWRSGDGAVREGALYLDGLLRPDDQAVAYVAAFVRSDRERAAALRLGSPGPLKVWITARRCSRATWSARPRWIRTPPPSGWGAAGTGF